MKLGTFIYQKFKTKIHYFIYNNNYLLYVNFKMSM